MPNGTTAQDVLWSVYRNGTSCHTSSDLVSPERSTAACPVVIAWATSCCLCL